MTTSSQKPAVSVVIPTYNRANTLHKCINSVLQQTFSDLELIIVDDASKDNTAEVLAGFDDPRIRYIKLEQNVGGGEARNIGVRTATADIIAFQDSDDEWRVSKLKICMDILQNNPNLNGVFSAVWKIKGTHARFFPARLLNNVDTSIPLKTLLKGNLIDTPATVIRKETLVKAGMFDPLMPRYQDWDIFLRVSKLGELHYIDEPLVLSYVTAGSISSSSEAGYRGALRIYEKHKTDIENDQQLHTYWQGWLGHMEMLFGNPRLGRKMLLQSALNGSFNGKQMLRVISALPASKGWYQFLKNRGQN